MSSLTHQSVQLAPCERSRQDNLKSCFVKTPRYSNVSSQPGLTRQEFQQVETTVSGDVPNCTKTGVHQVGQAATQCDYRHLGSEFDGILLSQTGKEHFRDVAPSDYSVARSRSQPGHAEDAHPNSEPNAELQDVCVDMPCPRMAEKGLVDGPQGCAGADGNLFLPGIANRRKAEDEDRHGCSVVMGDDNTLSEASTGTGSNSTGQVFSLGSAGTISATSALGSVDRYADEVQSNIGPPDEICPLITNTGRGCDGDEAARRGEHQPEFSLPSLVASDATCQKPPGVPTLSRLSLPIPSLRSSEVDTSDRSKEPFGLLLPGIASIQHAAEPPQKAPTEAGQPNGSGVASGLRILALARNSSPKSSMDQILPWRIKYLPSRGPNGHVPDAVGGVISSHECLTDDTTADGCQDYEEEDDDELIDGNDLQLPHGVGKRVRFAPLAPDAIYEYEQYDWEAEAYEAEEVFGRRSFEALSASEIFNETVEPIENLEATGADGVDADPSRMFIPLIGGASFVDDSSEEEEFTESAVTRTDDESPSSRSVDCKPMAFTSMASSFDDSGRLSNSSTRRAVKDRERTPHPSRQLSVSSQPTGDLGHGAASPFFPIETTENFGLTREPDRTDLPAQPSPGEKTCLEQTDLLVHADPEQSLLPCQAQVQSNATTEATVTDGGAFSQLLSDNESFATPTSRISHGFVTPSSVRTCCLEVIDGSHCVPHGPNHRRSIDLLSIDSTEFLFPVAGWRPYDQEGLSTTSEHGKQLPTRCVQVQSTIANRSAELAAALRLGVLSVASDDVDDGDLSTTSQGIRLTWLSPREPSPIDQSVIKASAWAMPESVAGFFTPASTPESRGFEKQQDDDVKQRGLTNDGDSVLQAPQSDQLIFPSGSQGSDGFRPDGSQSLGGVVSETLASTSSRNSTRIFNAGSGCCTPSSQRTAPDSSCRLGCAAVSNIQEHSLPHHACKNSAAFTAC